VIGSRFGSITRRVIPKELATELHS